MKKGTENHTSATTIKIVRYSASWQILQNFGRTSGKYLSYEDSN